MYDHLAQAIGRESWSEALELALAAWRTTRSDELAALVDVLAARSPRPTGLRIQQWSQAARPYDPTAVAWLVEHANTELAGRVSWEDLLEQHTDHRARDVLDGLKAAGQTMQRDARNTLPDRFLTILAWPDDPRTAEIATRWLEYAQCGWEPRQNTAFYNLVARLAARLADARVAARLTKLVDEPVGTTDAVRARQQEAARVAVELLPPRPAPDPEAAALLARFVHPPDARLDELWREVARHPRELGARLVLADALVQRGDPRGEMIALQCAPEQTNKMRVRADRLFHRHVRGWLGDLALVLPLRGLVYRHGMLASARIGNPATPPWAYARVAAHREMQCVTDLHAHQAPPDRFVAIVRELAAAPIERIAVNNDELAEAFGRSTPPLPSIRVLRMSRAAHHFEQRPLDEQLPQYARAFPAVEEIELWQEQRDYDRDELVAAAAVASSVFPKLRRFRIPKGWVRRAEIDAPPVEIGPIRY